MDIINILLMSPGWIIAGLFLLALFASLIIRQIDKKKGIDPEDETIVTTEKLHEELNEERKKHNKDALPKVNAVVNTNSLALRDKSFSSSIDFFVKLFKKQKD